MRYAHPGQPGALVSFKSAYGNFIDGKFVEPLSGEFFMNTSPVDGSNIAQFPRSDAKDIEFALDAAQKLQVAVSELSITLMTFELDEATCRMMPQSFKDVIIRQSDELVTRLETVLTYLKNDKENALCKTA